MPEHIVNRARPGTPFLAFDDEDIDHAHEAWGCNCGPAALAACLGWTLDMVRPHLYGFDQKGYMDYHAMARAVASAGYRVTPCDRMPGHGLLRVQWGGPWMLPGVHPGAAASHTHWIAAKRRQRPDTRWIFDVNAGWGLLDDWETGTARRIMASVKRCDGTFTFTHRWEVRKSCS